MDKQETSEGNRPIYKSYLTIEEQCVQVRVGFQINDTTILAGGIVELDFSIENQGNTIIYFLGGGSSSKKRPAYFSFEGNLRVKDTKLKDPLQNVVDLGGPVGELSLKPGETFKQKIILNQFLTLEELFNIVKKNDEDTLRIKCNRHLQIGKRQNDALTNTDTLVRNIELDLVVPVVRDEKKLIRYIENLTTTLKAQWKSNTSAVEELSVQRLTALRIPLVIEYLEQLQGHPNISFNYQIASALSNLKIRN